MLNKMASRLNSDKVICRALEDDFGLQRKKVANQRMMASLSLLETDYRPWRGGNSEQLHDLSNLWYP